MSTIKSSAENLTLNADGANNDIKFQSNGSEVASIDQAGLLTATTFAGSGASLTALPAANITGTLPAISGANLTGIVTGKVLQVVSGGRSSSPSTTSSSYVDAGLSLAITPSATSSKILIVANINTGIYGAAALTYPSYQLVRGSTALSDTVRDSVARGDGITGNLQFPGNHCWSYLDSPSTTSATTYKVQMKQHATYGGTIYVKGTSDMTLLEIAG